LLGRKMNSLAISFSRRAKDPFLVSSTIMAVPYRPGQLVIRTRKPRHYFCRGVVRICSRTVPDMVLPREHRSRKLFLLHAARRNMITKCLKGLS